jgi:solute carrier family 25 oxoglutarate transporter 11
MKGFVERGIASIVAGCATHLLDLLKVRMQLQGETQAPIPKLAVQNLRPALAFHATSLSALGSIHLPTPTASGGACGPTLRRHPSGPAIRCGLVVLGHLRQTL